MATAQSKTARLFLLIPRSDSPLVRNINFFLPIKMHENGNKQNGEAEQITWRVRCPMLAVMPHNSFIYHNVASFTTMMKWCVTD